MQPAQVYIVGLGKFLPNAPVDNDAIESVLGMVGGRPSRARRITLRNNGIQTRYYALDPATGRATHNNAQLTALAAQQALRRADWQVRDLDLLTCGTSSPDQLKPAHASMVHAELGGATLEAVSTAGVCSSGVTALKYAYLSIKGGDARRAIATGSELASNFMVARNFAPEADDRVDDAQGRPELAFEKDFLRWMLSDGAGAASLTGAPVPGRPALRIDGIEGVSLANELPVCMYSGAVKQPDGRLTGWRDAPSPMEAAREHYFAVKQDARLLDQHITRLVAPDTIAAFAAKHALRASEVDWFLPHYSSQYFRPVLAKALAASNFAIPDERWFTNLTTVGNVGAASVYLMLEALLYSGKLERGQRVLCFVPESARFSVYYMLLTVV
jgi:3-oxoacyl-[acyl-carrier-protein] synthase III